MEMNLQPKKSLEGWEQKVLLKFTQDPKDHWTVDDAVKGTSIIGGTGSGKTSGSGKTIALQFLKQGWGGLVLCAKTEEAQLWQQYCKEAGREADLIVFGKNNRRNNELFVFNPLHYETTRIGAGSGDVFNITSIFMNLHKIANRASNDGDSKKDDRFWDNALKRIISRTVELIKLAEEELTFYNIVELIYSAPTERKPFDSQHFNSYVQRVKFIDDTDGDLNRNFFLKCLGKAFCKIADKEETHPDCYTFQNIYRYFTSSLPNMSEHTHNAIIESFMGVAEPFLSGILKTHFSGKTNLYPEEIFMKNKIILLDFPVKEFLDAGVMAQCVFKQLFQQAVERRNVKKYQTPVFLWADEAQYFINSYDQLFLTTARSSRTATVFLSQNISNYYAVMGSGSEAKPKVDSFMGNLATKIFHANSDAVTNKYASEMIGQTISFLSKSGFSHKFLSLDFNRSKDMSATVLPQIQPMEFTRMKSGGAYNGYDVEAVVFVTGKQWTNGTNYIKTIFQQNFS